MNVDRPTLNTLGLCAGVGMLEEGIRAGLDFLGFDSRPLAYVEREAFAASILVARMDEEAMESAPIWCGDLRLFDGRPFRGLVDILCAGLPCQPYSLAGAQRGNADERSFGDGEGPLPSALRIIAECEPAMVFFENVGAWVAGGHFREFGAELCRLGYALEEPLFLRASDVGASHKRERVFIMAYSRRLAAAGNNRPLHRGQHQGGADAETGGATMGYATSDNERWDSIASMHGKGEQVGGSGGHMADAGERLVQEPGRGSQGREGSGSGGAALEHAEGIGEREPADAADSLTVGGRTWDESRDRSGAMAYSTSRRPGINAHTWRQSVEGRRDSQPVGESMAFASGAGLQGDGQERGDEEWHDPTGPVGSCRRSLFAPGPQSGFWGSVIADSPHFAPAIEPGFRLLADGFSYVVDESRTEQLRAAGNGVVPLCAATAFVELFQRRAR